MLPIFTLLYILKLCLFYVLSLFIFQTRISLNKKKYSRTIPHLFTNYTLTVHKFASKNQNERILHENLNNPDNIVHKLYTYFVIIY